jgi:hypothetical protein
MDRTLFRNDVRLAGEWNERRWAMVKMARLGSAGALLGLGVCLLAQVPSARALTTSDRPAAILVWPKIVVADGTDTIIQISNTSRTDRKQAHCFLINANGHCADTDAVCSSALNCPSRAGFATCVPGWSETDFDIYLTKDQPLAWNASAGLSGADLPITVNGFCDYPPTRACTHDSECGSKCMTVQNNLGTGIPPVPEIPFVGELKCIEFVPGNPPVPDASNTLLGEATIESMTGPNNDVPDLQKYNAVGLQACAAADRPCGPNATSAPTLPNLQLGGDASTQEYQGCPTTLILNHLFDVGRRLVTDLTLVPCGDDLLRQNPGMATAQFLVFNEFEQRFSTSKTVRWFFESQLSRIDTPDPDRSIFSYAISGTLAGQTRIKPVGDAPTGRGLVGIARQLFTDRGISAGAAYELHQQGNPTQPDIITVP